MTSGNAYALTICSGEEVTTSDATSTSVDPGSCGPLWVQAVITTDISTLPATQTVDGPVGPDFGSTSITPENHDGVAKDIVFVSTPYYDVDGSGTLTAGDVVGETITFTLTVQPAPTITCIMNQTRDTDPATCTYTVDGTEFDPVITGSCTPLVVTYELTGATATGVTTANSLAGLIFYKGTTTVTWTVTNSGTPTSSATCSFDVLVEDNEIPTLACPANIVSNSNPSICGNTEFWTNPTATDNCTATPALEWDIFDKNNTLVSHQTGLMAGNGVNYTFGVGVNTVTYTATDASGNPATCFFTVTINDAQPPVLQPGTCPANITVNDTNGDCSENATWVAPIFSDNCSFTGSFMVSSDYNPGASFLAGVTTVTYTATDGTNSTVCTFDVIVTSTPMAVDDVNSPAVSPGSDAVVNVVTNDMDCDTNIDASTVDFAPGIAGQQTIMTVLGEGEWTVDANGEVTFSPEAGFTIDPTPITYVVKDGSGNTSNVATITADYLPIASDDLSDNNNAGSVEVDVLANDLDGDYVDPTTVSLVTPVGATNVVTDGNGDVTSMDIPGEGTWSVNGATGAITFTPHVALVGDPTPINYTVNDHEGNPSNQALVTIEYTLCVEIEAWVYLEGSAIAPNGSSNYSIPMRSELNDKRLLPGQYSSSPLGNYYSPPGQPYSVAPWNYMGTEGYGYDSDEMVGNADAGYPSDVVDWVLVSLRDKVVDPFNLLGDYKPDLTPICTAAALLHTDGSIEFIDGFTCCELDVSETYYLVIEHRNHLLVSSHEPVPIINGVISYDFRSQQSYIQIAFGSPNGSGQKEVSPGVFVMHAGNGDQAPDPTADTFIGFGDEAFLKSEYGQVLRYLNGDYNMNGSPNSLDRILWGFNNGKSSAVPRN